MEREYRMQETKETVRKIYEVLPRKNDKLCGYNTCGQFARAVAEGEAPCYGCVTGGSLVAEEVCAVIGKKVPAAVKSNYDRPEQSRLIVRGAGVNTRLSTEKHLFRGARGHDLGIGRRRRKRGR